MPILQTVITHTTTFIVHINRTTSLTDGEYTLALLEGPGSQLSQLPKVLTKVSDTTLLTEVSH